MCLNYCPFDLRFIIGKKKKKQPETIKAGEIRKSIGEGVKRRRKGRRKKRMEKKVRKMKERKKGRKGVKYGRKE